MIVTVVCISNTAEIVGVVTSSTEVSPGPGSGHQEIGRQPQKLMGAEVTPSMHAFMLVSEELWYAFQ